ncbi:hypothetical protein [Paraburkholderia aspalathi]|uniref:hypothetical protein n=1 Tax=Paraburkholderia aspalathi TaxID=1324617 RepID=UPI001AFE6D18|nr:hypothetical protein [Paraburkholderia aspalathi]CAE6754535.1 hypothetical protein R20943_03075 [Paraburkholderia aspalathi]
MTILTKLLGAFALMVSVAAVAQDTGSQFIGTWKKVHGRGPDTEVIERHGDFFVIKSPKLLMPTETEQTSARLKDGALEIQDELGNRAIRVDASNGHMFTTHGEYVQVSR